MKLEARVSGLVHAPLLVQWHLEKCSSLAGVASEGCDRLDLRRIIEIHFLRKYTQSEKRVNKKISHVCIYTTEAQEKKETQKRTRYNEA